MRDTNNTIHVIKSAQSMQYALVLNGLLVGVAAGGVAVIYRILLDRAESAMRWILAIAKNNPPLMLLWFVALFVMGAIVGHLVRAVPMISGSGIPQISGEIKGYLNQNWLQVILAKIVGGTLCILGGLSLGREGPSIQLGAMVGKGVSHLLHRVKTEEKYLITCGAGAGLAAAFNAPLAGVLFALEEIHQNFSAAALVSVLTAAVAADFVSKSVFGLTPVFHFDVVGALPLQYYWLLVILGVFLGALGALYNHATLAAQKCYAKIPHLRPEWRPMIPFLLAGILGVTVPQVLGGGHVMIELLYDGKLLLPTLLTLLVVKFLFSLCSFGSGAPGGIFFPLLILGAYLGGAFGIFCIRFFGVETAFLNHFIVLAMAGFFTAIVRAPVTGIILIAEMTGSFSHMLSLSTVCLIAYVVAYLFRSKPIYESLLDGILQKNGIVEPEDTGEKIMTSAVIRQGARIAGHPVSELNLPRACLLVAVRRGEREMIPRGDTTVLTGDTLVALVDACDYAAIAAQLQECCE